MVLVVFNRKQAIIDSLKHCTLTVANGDGSEDLLIHCLKSIQSCAAGLDRLKQMGDITYYRDRIFLRLLEDRRRHKVQKSDYQSDHDFVNSK